MTFTEGMPITKIDENIHKIDFEDYKVLYLIGTAHISQNSVNLVEEAIEKLNPDTIAVEIDDQRLEIIMNKKKYEETDIIEIIKSGETLRFVAQLLLSAYQKRMGEKTGVVPGAEFKKAIDLSIKGGKRLITADRNINITLKRIMRKMSFLEKAKTLISFFFAKDEVIDEKKIEEIKNTDALVELLKQMGHILPTVKKVLIDERNLFLANRIKDNLGNVTVAVVGAGHVPGIIEKMQINIKSEEVEDINRIPPQSFASKFLPWLIPATVFGMVILGFFKGGADVAKESIIYWVLINGVLTAVATVLALGHPLSIIAGFIAAPITSLNPTIGAGIVVGLVQIFMVRPKVVDFENISENINSIKGWWSSPLTRALIVTVFSSIGSSIGTIVAFPYLIKNIL